MCEDSVVVAGILQYSYRWMGWAVLLAFIPAVNSAWAAVPDQADPHFTLSLNGVWEFVLTPTESAFSGETFFQKDFSYEGWKTIPVPGHWELMGFLPPRDGPPGPGAGFYRRQFTIPKGWDNRRYFLRFEGVIGDFQVWVDGRMAGRQPVSSLPGQFEITSLVDHTNEHLVAVRVESARNVNFAETTDLSGIFRDVRLFAVPALCIDDWTVQTEIKGNGESAQVGIVIQLVRVDEGQDWSDIRVNCRLAGPDGATVAEVEIASLEVAGNQATGRASLPVSQPLFWTAETPHLYQLIVELKQSGQVRHKTSSRIGIRQVSIRKGEFLLNGEPIHLRGVNYTEYRPDVGMALREDDWRQDLTLMQQANINTIRVLSGPPHPRFLEICDEMGFYVIGEMPAYLISPATASECILDSSSEDSGARRAQTAMKAESAESILFRDRNHPCLIAWSLGDQPVWDPALRDIVQTVRALDPTRPVLVPGCADPSLPPEVEILAPYNPSPETWKKLARAGRPVIAASHTPALGNAVEGLDEFWQAVREHRTLAGGLLQQFADSLPPGAYPHGVLGSGDYRSNGRDGIINADRTPQIDYWQVRKIYSPVHIEETVKPVHPGRQTIEIPLRNEHDFLNLAALRCRWFLLRDFEPVLERSLLLQLPPRQEMEVALVVDIPDDLPDHEYAIRLEFYDPSERQVTGHAVRLRPRDWDESFLLRLRDLKWDDEFRVVGDAFEIRSQHRDYAFIIQQTTAAWFLRAQDHNVRLITGGPCLRVGRELSFAELRHGPVGEASPLWQPPLLCDLWVDSKQMGKAGHDSFVQSLLVARNPGHPDLVLRAQVDYLFSPFGYCDVRFIFDTEMIHGSFLETGLAFLVPSTLDQVAWLGNGPYPSWPGQEALSSWGMFYINPLNRLQPGNRSHVNVLSFRDANGFGLGILMLDGQVSLEPGSGGTWVSINTAVAGPGNGASATRRPLIADQLAPGQRSAAFRLIPLVRNRYPAVFQNLWNQALKMKNPPIP
ncbi:MAG: hypothetical protein HPY51_12395 [Candidatus Omnitrophica bacterium]|nr:hypothetical protein [Candidatus Omnitrophota bacterium]